MATTRKTATKSPTKTAGRTPARQSAKKTPKNSAKKPLAKKPGAKAPAAKPATKTVAKKPLAKKAAAKTPASRPTAKKPTKTAPKTATKTTTAEKSAKKQPRRSANGFRINEFIVYPAHGVGQIIDIADQEIAGMSLELFVVNFEKEKMVLRVPLDKAKQVGMRKLADNEVMEGAMKTLRGRARIKRTMWSRRAQEYEAKINSGDLIAIAEVVRDLFRNENQPEQSYSERQLYEAALERMAREVATVNKTTDDEAILSLEAILAKTTGGARRKNDNNEAA